MPKRRKRTSEPSYEFLGIELTSYTAHTDASINCEVRDRRHYHDEAKVYKFGSYVELSGTCNYPEDRVGENFAITVNSYEPHEGEFALTLHECHVRNETGGYKYRKVRGKELPVYEIPKGLGLLERQRGDKTWRGWAWVAPHIVSDMLTLLPAYGLYMSRFTK